MCAAILSASGDVFIPEAFLADSTLAAKARVWRIGEKHKSNGFQVIVADTEVLSDQVHGVIRFIQSHLAELKRLRDFDGIQSLDLRIAYFWAPGIAALTYTLPSELHLALAHIRATLTFCVYPCSENENGA